MGIKEILSKEYSLREILPSFFKIFLPNFLDCFGLLGFIAFVPSILLCAYAMYDTKFQCTGYTCGSAWGWIFAFAFIWFIFPFFLLSIVISIIKGCASKEYKMSKKWLLILKAIGLMFYTYIIFAIVYVFIMYAFVF